VWVTGEDTITIECAQVALAPIAKTPEAVGKKLRWTAAIEWYREGRVSQDKFAGIAGSSGIDFTGALE
jgi:hypothetical protein